MIFQMVDFHFKSVTFFINVCTQSSNFHTGPVNPGRENKNSSKSEKSWGIVNESGKNDIFTASIDLCQRLKEKFQVTVILVNE